MFVGRGIIAFSLLVFAWGNLWSAENPVRVFVSTRDAPESVSKEMAREAYDAFKSALEQADHRHDEAVAQLKSTYGKKRKLWPSDEKESITENRTSEIEQAYHRYHIARNEKTDLEGSTGFVRKYFAEGNPVGPGKLSSVFDVVDGPGESDLQVEVVGRHIREGYGSVTCVRVSLGEQVFDDRSTIASNPWEKYPRSGVGFVTAVLHEFNKEEPYWLIHQAGGDQGGIDIPYWRESCAEVTRLIDWFVQGNPDLFQ